MISLVNTRDFPRKYKSKKIIIAINKFRLLGDKVKKKKVHGVNVQKEYENIMTKTNYNWKEIYDARENGEYRSRLNYSLSPASGGEYRTESNKQK